MLRVSWRYSSILLIAFVCLSPWVASEEHYRDDYVFNKNNKAFYKLHTEEVNYKRAQRVCDVEGATLIEHASYYDKEFVKGLFMQFPHIGPYVWIGGETVQGCAVMDSDGHKNVKWIWCLPLITYPFVCKAMDAVYDIECTVNARGYRRLPNTDSCYKIPRISYTWDQANAECRSEGANLVVLNSEAERAAVHSLILSTTLPNDSYFPLYYLAGMRAYQPNIKPKVFLTIFNQTLKEAGFSEWASGEPSNDNGREHCGCIYTFNGKYNDCYCDTDFGFICEKEIISKDILNN